MAPFKRPYPSVMSCLCAEGPLTSWGLLLLCVQVEALVPHDAAEVDKPAHRKRIRQIAFDGERCSMLPGRLQGCERQLAHDSMIASNCLLVRGHCTDVWPLMPAGFQTYIKKISGLTHK